MCRLLSQVYYCVLKVCDRVGHGMWQVKSDLRQGTLLEIESAPGSTRGQPAQSVLISSGGSTSRGGQSSRQARKGCAPGPALPSSAGDVGKESAAVQVVRDCSSAALRAAPLAAQAGCMRRWQCLEAAAAAGKLGPAQTQPGAWPAQGAELAGSIPQAQVGSLACLNFLRKQCNNAAWLWCGQHGLFCPWLMGCMDSDGAWEVTPPDGA